MSAFRKWYETHKAEFNAARAFRRKTDPAYAQRQKSYKRKPEPKTGPSKGVNLTYASEACDLTVWILNGWREKNWLPPLVQQHGQLWMHEDNLGLLVEFQKQLKSLGRTPEATKVEDLVNWLSVNWTVLEKEHGA